MSLVRYPGAGSPFSISCRADPSRGEEPLDSDAPDHVTRRLRQTVASPGRAPPRKHTRRGVNAAHARRSRLAARERTQWADGELGLLACADVNKNKHVMRTLACSPIGFTLERVLFSSMVGWCCRFAKGVLGLGLRRRTLSPAARCRRSPRARAAGHPSSRERPATLATSSSSAVRAGSG